MRLFIAEKPSLGRAIAENLGKGVAKDGCIECSGGQDIVTWCFGHILEQCDPGEYDESHYIDQSFGIEKLREYDLI